MKKLKFFALALVAAFGMASCNEDPAEEGVSFKEGLAVMGGASSANGSFFTADKGVQTKTQLGDNAQQVVFCASVAETTELYSGTEATNEIVKAQAKETKFAGMKKADAETYNKLTTDKFTATKIAVKVGDVYAFSNPFAKGFFEVTALTESDLSLKTWILEEKAPVAE